VRPQAKSTSARDDYAGRGSPRRRHTTLKSRINTQQGMFDLNRGHFNSPISSPYFLLCLPAAMDRGLPTRPAFFAGLDLSCPLISANWLILTRPSGKTASN